MFEATYNDTGLTSDEAVEMAEKSGKFSVVPRFGDDLHVMLYPKEFRDVKVQISRDSANVWFQGFNLGEIEDLLNRTFYGKYGRNHFKNPKIQLMPGEMRRILETPSGLIITLVYYFQDEIKESLNHIFQSMDTWDQWRPKESLKSN